MNPPPLWMATRWQHVHGRFVVAVTQADGQGGTRAGDWYWWVYEPDADGYLMTVGSSGQRCHESLEAAQLEALACLRRLTGEAS